MFQAMINAMMRDLINTGKVASFIDDVVVETESEKGYNELAKNIIKKNGKEQFIYKAKEV